MKKIFLILLILSMSITFAQEIKVIKKEKSKSVIEIKTVGNKQVPIYKILSESSGVVPIYGGTLNIHQKALALIGNAPLSLELDAGLYEFQIYQTGNKRMIIESNGYDQVWEIKPKGKHKKTAWVIGLAGTAVVIAGAVTGFSAFSAKMDYDRAVSDYEWDLDAYYTDVKWYNKNPDFFSAPGSMPTPPASYDNSLETMTYSLVGVGITTITTGIITWLLNQPSAKQVN